MCNDGERVGVGKGCQVYYQLSIQIQCILSILSNNIPAKKGVRDSNLNECTHVQGKSLRVYCASNFQSCALKIESKNLSSPTVFEQSP